MVERAIVRLIIPEVPEQGAIPIEPQEPSLEISWYGMHPGDVAESALRDLIKEKTNFESGKSFNEMFSRNGLIIYTKWYSIDSGIIIFYDLLGLLSQNTVPSMIFSRTVWFYEKLIPKTWEDLFEIYLTEVVGDFDPEIVKEVDLHWLRESLEGGNISLNIADQIIFCKELTKMIELLPWSVYLIKKGVFLQDKFSLDFHKCNMNQSINYESLLNSMFLDASQQFRLLLQKTLLLMHSYPPEERLSLIYNLIFVIYLITRTDVDELEKLELSIRYMEELLTIDVDYASTFIGNVLSAIPSHQPSLKIANLLLDLGSELIDQKFADLAKLAEGTALQVAFLMKNLEDREKIILKVTERSKDWGVNHLVGYIQSITGILAENTENQSILLKVVDSSQPMLEKSWDGILCLVETSIIAGETMKAVELRMNATSLLSDKFARAEDIITAIIWSIEQDDLVELEFIEVMFEKLSEAVPNLAIGDIFLNHMDNILLASIGLGKYVVLGRFIEWVEENLQEIGINDRLPLVQNLEAKILQEPNLQDFLIEIQVIKFKQLLDSGSGNDLDEAEMLIRSIFNSINPQQKNGADLIQQISRKLLSISGDYRQLELIEEVRKRFELFIGDKEIIRKTLLEVYVTIASKRAQLSRSKLDRNDIGIKLFLEASKIANVNEDSKQIIKFAPNAKLLAMKTNSFDSYSDFTLLELRASRYLEIDWFRTALNSAEDVLDKGSISSSRRIFSTILEQNLTPEQEAEVLSTQLRLVELDPDLLEGGEIFIKRNRLIELTTNQGESANVNEILNQYRDGISVLMTKDNPDTLHKFLLDAITFSISNKLSSVEEFSSILLDSFSANLQTYTQTGNFSIYRELIKLYRLIVGQFRDLNLDLPIQLSNVLIKNNLDKTESSGKTEFLRRAQLLGDEISSAIKYAIEQNTPFSDVEFNSLIVNYRAIVDQLIDSDLHFGLINGFSHSMNFYKNIGQQQTLFEILDEALSGIKKEAVKSKQIDSGTIVALLTLSDAIIHLEAEFKSELSSEIIDRTIKLLDVIISMPMNGNAKLVKRLKNFQTELRQNSVQALLEFPFSLDSVLQELDTIN